MTDNYAIAAKAARERFCTYDPAALCRKLGRIPEEGHLRVSLLGQCYRIRLSDGAISRQVAGQWREANSFAEVMVLLDLVCDSREDRHPAHRWKSLSAFGQLFHRQLLEGVDPNARDFAAKPEAFRRACQALGGVPFPQGDIAYRLPFFEELSIVLQLWLGDEEFPDRLSLLLDENANAYLRYETMHYARGLLLRLLREEMEHNPLPPYREASPSSCCRARL